MVTDPDLKCEHYALSLGVRIRDWTVFKLEGSFDFQMSMNVSPDLVLTVEHARIYKEATDANADRDFSGNTARQVHINTVLNLHI